LLAAAADGKERQASPHAGRELEEAEAFVSLRLAHAYERQCTACFPDRAGPEQLLFFAQIRDVGLEPLTRVLKSA
jgi:hypothetical protein